MDKIKKAFNNPPQTCINCIYCRNLNLFRREIVSIGPDKNIISRLGIEEHNSSYNHSLCCILFQEEDISAPIYETSPNDFCEKFKFKYIIDKDEQRCFEYLDNESLYWEKEGRQDNKNEPRQHHQCQNNKEEI